MNALPAAQALDSFFLEGRCKILDVAAILDRIDRGAGATGTGEDPRMAKIRQALDVLKDPQAAKAERIQQIFSIPYDATWKIPAPRTVG
jgi:hypothetical protein